MSEIGEMFSGFDEISKAKRSNNRESSAGLLRDRGVSFESKNDGAHLVVKHNDMVYDFWPGTGKYIRRGTTKYRRGVFNLLREIKA